MNNSEILDVVDKENKLVGTASRGEIYIQGLYHRSVAIWVFRGEDILLQQRGQGVEVGSGLWDLSTAGHVKQGEPYLVAAKRELKEETGLNGHSLRVIRKHHLWHYKYPNGLIDNEMMMTFRCGMDGEIRKDGGELKELKYFPVSKVKKWVESRPEEFTPWFLEEWSYLLGKEVV